MPRFSIFAVGLLGVATSVGLAVAKPSQECNQLQDACVIEPDAAKRAAKCKTFHDKCEVTLGEKIDRLTDPPKKNADKGGKKGPSGKKGGSSSGKYEVTYRSASGGNGKVIWVVMPDGSTVPVRQGVPGGAFLTKVIDGKTYSVEFVKTVDGVSYNVADPAYEAAVAASKQKHIANRSKLGGAVSGVPARPPGGQLPRGGGATAGLNADRSAQGNAQGNAAPGSPPIVATPSRQTPAMGGGAFGVTTSKPNPGPMPGPAGVRRPEASVGCSDLQETERTTLCANR